MPKIHTIKHGELKAKYSIGQSEPFEGVSLPGLRHYEQQDHYSCGFIAALTIVSYFKPGVYPKDVLSAVQCVDVEGTSRKKIITALDHFGIWAEYRDDMTISDLLSLIHFGLPVAVTVWPDGWKMDHWTVVEGFDRKHNVHLINHYKMSPRDFWHEWVEPWGEEWKTGAGLICSLR